MPERRFQMNNENNNNHNTGISFVGMFVVLLSVAFIVMRIAGIIEWSWVWVLAPLWIYAGLCVILVIAIVVLAAIAYIKR